MTEMRACPTCPNRHHADTLDALAEAARVSRLFRVFAPALRRRAEQVRAAGCQWLWNVWVEGEDDQPEPRTVCGSSHMAHALNKLGGEVMLASQTIQEDRNEQAKAIQKIKAAIAEHGGGEAPQALAGMGFLGLVGRELAEGPGNDDRSAPPAGSEPQ